MVTAIKLYQIRDCVARIRKSIKMWRYAVILALLVVLFNLAIRERLSGLWIQAVVASVALGALIEVMLRLAVYRSKRVLQLTRVLLLLVGCAGIAHVTAARLISAAPELLTNSWWIWLGFLPLIFASLHCIGRILAAHRLTSPGMQIEPLTCVRRGMGRLQFTRSPVRLLTGGLILVAPWLISIVAISVASFILWDLLRLHCGGDVGQMMSVMMGTTGVVVFVLLNLLGARDIYRELRRGDDQKRISNFTANWSTVTPPKQRTRWWFVVLTAFLMIVVANPFIGSSKYFLKAVFFDPVGGMISVAILLLSFLFYFGLPLLAVRCWYWARRRLLPTAKEVAQRDRRAPLLLLRAFSDDDMEVIRSGRGRRILGWAMGPLMFETILVRSLSAHGPVTAIGRPNDLLPPLGAARDYVSDDEWQTRVEEMARDAQIIVMVVGATIGLGWEVRKLASLKMFDKIVFVIPPVSDKERERRWEVLRTSVADQDLSSRLFYVRPKEADMVLISRTNEPVMLSTFGHPDAASYQVLFAAAVQVMGTYTEAKSSRFEEPTG